MKRLSVAVAATVVALTACTGSNDQQAQTADDSQLKQEAKEWVQQSKELGSAAVGSAKDAAGKAGEKSKEYYEAAKVKGGDLMGKAEEKGAAMLESGKADMEARQGHPPALGGGEMADQGAGNSGELMQKGAAMMEPVKAEAAMMEAGKAEMETKPGLAPATGQ